MSSFRVVRKSVLVMIVQVVVMVVVRGNSECKGQVPEVRLAYSDIPEPERDICNLEKYNK